MNKMSSDCYYSKNLNLRNQNLVDALSLRSIETRERNYITFEILKMKFNSQTNICGLTGGEY